MAVEPNRWGIIYNPKAGSRKTQKRWNEIRSYMENRKVVFDYVQSEGFGSVERLARTLANNGYRTIVIVGGDGAINDAINGIMTSMVEDKTNIAFGIIPNGIGNDFAKYWGLDEDNYKAAVDWIINRRLREIDVGRCNYFDGEKHTSRYFLNAIYIGLGARIVQISDGTRRFWGIRELSFAASMFLLLFERKLYRTHLCINGEHIRGRIMTVCVGSARGYGLTPSAVPYNGWLDVSVIYRPELIQLFSGMWMLLQGRILNHKMVKPYRTRKVKVLRAQNASVSLDGRILDRHFPLEITIQPEAITLIIPITGNAHDIHKLTVLGIRSILPTGIIGTWDHLIRGSYSLQQTKVTIAEGSIHTIIPILRPFIFRAVMDRFTIFTKIHVDDVLRHFHIMGGCPFNMRQYIISQFFFYIFLIQNDAFHSFQVRCQHLSPVTVQFGIRIHQLLGISDTSIKVLIFVPQSMIFTPCTFKKAETGKKSTDNVHIDRIFTVTFFFYMLFSVYQIVQYMIGNFFARCTGTICYFLIRITQYAIYPRHIAKTSYQFRIIIGTEEISHRTPMLLVRIRHP